MAKRRPLDRNAHRYCRRRWLSKIASVVAFPAQTHSTSVACATASATSTRCRHRLCVRPGTGAGMPRASEATMQSAQGIRLTASSRGHKQQRSIRLREQLGCSSTHVWMRSDEPRCGSRPRSLSRFSASDSSPMTLPISPAVTAIPGRSKRSSPSTRSRADCT